MDIYCLKCNKLIQTARDVEQLVICTKSDELCDECVNGGKKMLRIRSIERKMFLDDRRAAKLFKQR